MEYLILIDGEIRSLIRNSLERFIGLKVGSKKDKVKNILLKLSTRVIASLIAIQIFGYLKSNDMIKQYGSYLMVALFVYLTVVDKN